MHIKKQIQIHEMLQLSIETLLKQNKMRSDKGFSFYLKFSWIFINFYVGLVLGERSTYIVHMDKSHMPMVFASAHHWYNSIVSDIISASPDKELHGHHITASHLYTYDNALHGFSTVLSGNELQILKQTRGVLSAYRDTQVTIHTTYTTDYLKLNPVTGLWPASDYGENVIVGVLDSGIWPESKSFNDHGMSAIPSKWKGSCDEGQEFSSSLCNKKLIGSRYFNKGVIAADPNTTISMNSARDYMGHGTHTSSIVAGNYVRNVSFFGYATGVATGVASRARLAMYKVMWNEGSRSSDVLAGIDQAVADGVDVISISLALTVYRPLNEDPIAIASFGAMEKGILVSFSSGNSGPSLGKLRNGFPWALTVAAGSIDRRFSGALSLGNGLVISGWSLYPIKVVIDNLPLIYNKTLFPCNSSELLADAPFGILICDSSNRTIDQSPFFSRSKTPAVIFITDDQRGFQFNQFLYPGVIIGTKDLKEVIKYKQSVANANATMTFQQTFYGTNIAPRVASFSSRGPSPSYPGILKPDLMAPGTLVLAAWKPNEPIYKNSSELNVTSDFHMISGTSMACPHASGVAALLKGAHPEWSPAAIRSAMMTTATYLDNIFEPIKDIGLNLTIATPLAMGSGQVDPNRALNPGLIYDVTPQDYVNLLCSMNMTRNHIVAITRSSNYTCLNPSSDLNYPSFIAFFDNHTTGVMQTKFERTLTNVGRAGITYNVHVTEPEGTNVSVFPKELTFGDKHEKHSYTLVITYENDKSGSVRHGSIVWIEEGGIHTVRSPIVVSPLIQTW